MHLDLSKPAENGDTSTSFEVPADKFRVLVGDLQAARALMETV
jgi:hypothetical protein